MARLIHRTGIMASPCQELLKPSTNCGVRHRQAAQDEVVAAGAGADWPSRGEHAAHHHDRPNSRREGGRPRPKA